MSGFLFGLGEFLTILSLVGLVGVLVFTALTALKLKTSVMTNAGRLYKRPLAAGKNLVTTAKGIAQQETVRGKHIGASATAAAFSVRDAAVHIKDAALNVKDAAGEVHPERLKPALNTVSNAGKIVKTVVGLSRAVSKQKVR